MKVLILHQHFNTPQEGGALRSYYLATALAAHGNKPIVITSHNKKQYNIIDQDGIEVHYLPVPYNNHFGFWKRSFSFLRFAWGVFRLAGNYREAEVCYAISAPLTVGLAALSIQRRYRIPYIFEVGDLWPDAPIQLGFVKNRILKDALYRLEKAIYKNAQSIVALSDMIKSGIEKKVPNKKIHVIPNMADTDFYRQEDKDQLLEKKFGVEGKFVVSYIGAVGMANGLDFFIECARESQFAKLPVYFLLCGDGAMLESLKQTVEKLQLSNFFFIAFQNREGVRAVMNVTDAIFICYKPIPILETGSPNKYFDGLASGKLIISNFGGWIEDETAKQQCGISVDATNPIDFVKQIEPFVKSPSLLRQFQQQSRLLAESRYARKMLSIKFAEVFR